MPGHYHHRSGRIGGSGRLYATYKEIEDSKSRRQEKTPAPKPEIRNWKLLESLSGGRLEFVVMNSRKREEFGITEKVMQTASAEGVPSRRIISRKSFDRLLEIKDELIKLDEQKRLEEQSKPMAHNIPSRKRHGFRGSWIRHH